MYRAGAWEVPRQGFQGDIAVTDRHPWAGWWGGALTAAWGSGRRPSDAMDAMSMSAAPGTRTGPPPSFWLWKRVFRLGLQQSGLESHLL